jgi:hypothetical protein
MIYEELKRVYDMQPFRTYTLLLGDGTKVKVSRPEAIWLPSKPSRIVFVESQQGRVLSIDLLLVDAIAQHALRPPGSNGKPPRRKA